MFKDHFSGHAANYSTFRPSYPTELYEWLADTCRLRKCAWDCATGNGQAARTLAKFFSRVVATDASAEQIAHATAPDNVHFQLGSAERSELLDESIDLVTVAQALHWFDLGRFYAEVQRVLKPGGVLAVWSYQLGRISQDVDVVVGHLYKDITGPYWFPERGIVDSGYRGLPFPFKELQVPQFSMSCEWTFGQLTGYLETWSGTQRYREVTGSSALDHVTIRLQEAWGDPQAVRTVTWPLNVRVGYRE